MRRWRTTRPKVIVANTDDSLSWCASTTSSTTAIAVAAVARSWVAPSQRNSGGRAIPKPVPKAIDAVNINALPAAACQRPPVLRNAQKPTTPLNSSTAKPALSTDRCSSRSVTWPLLRCSLITRNTSGGDATSARAASSAAVIGEPPKCMTAVCTPAKMRIELDHARRAQPRVCDEPAQVGSVAAFEEDQSQPDVGQDHHAAIAWPRQPAELSMREGEADQGIGADARQGCHTCRCFPDHPGQRRRQQPTPVRRLDSSAPASPSATLRPGRQYRLAGSAARRSRHDHRPSDALRQGSQPRPVWA